MATLYLPLPLATLVERTGKRSDGTWHTGWDFAVPVGTPIPATSDGTIVYVGDDGLGGMTIDLRRDDGLIQRFGHLSKYLVKVGQRVSAGTIIALSGNTGYTFGPHLHWECRWDRIWTGGRWVDPATLNPQTLDSSVTTTQKVTHDMLMIHKPTGDANVNKYAIFGTGFWLEFVGGDTANKLAGQILLNGSSTEVSEGFWEHCKSAAGAGKSQVDAAAITAAIVDGLKGIDLNADELVEVFAKKLAAALGGDSETTKAEILAAIQANYPEGK